MTVDRDDNAVYALLGINICLCISLNDSAIADSAFGMQQCADTVANVTKLHPRCQAVILADMVVGLEPLAYLVMYPFPWNSKNTRVSGKYF